MMALPSECSSETLIRPSVRHFCHCFLRGQGGRVGRYQLFSCFFYFISLYQKQHVIISFPFHAIEAQTREQRSPAASLVRPPPLNFKFYFKFNLFLWRKKRRCSAVLRTFQFSVVEDCYQLPRSPSLLLSSPNKVQCVASISYVVVLWFWCVGRRSLGRKLELVDFFAWPNFRWQLGWRGDCNDSHASISLPDRYIGQRGGVLLDWCRARRGSSASRATGQASFEK